MPATPFALVAAADHDKVLAYGLDIDLPSGRDVITYRRDPNGHNTFAIHRSVESAQRGYSRITPVDLVWEPGCRC